MRSSTILVATVVATSWICMSAGGCAREVYHSEKDSPGLLGGQTHEEKTVYKNPDGTYSTEKVRSTSDH